MKQETLISVIVPVYNVQQYLSRCIQSILNQTYKNLEIWLIDDGSTDQSGQICDQYAQKDRRIQVIHKENGGLSDARNVAIDKMTGTYVTFIDSDDFVADCFIERLYNHARKYQAGVVISGFLPTKRDREEYKIKNEIQVFTTEEALKALLYQKQYNTSAWGKIYLSSLFREVRYPKGKLFEDICTTYQMIEQTDRIVYDSSKLYFYYQGNVSIVRSGFNKKKMDYVYNTKILQDFIYKEYPNLKPGADFRFLWANLHIWVNVPDRHEYLDICRVLEKNIKKFRLKALFNLEVSLKNKIPIALSFFGWRVTRMIYRCSKK